MAHLTPLYTAVDERSHDAPDPRTLEKELTRAFVMHRQRDVVAARLCYEEILSSWPDCADAAELLAELHVDNDDTEAALQVVRSAVTRQPDHLKLLQRLGELLVKRGRPEDAIQVYRRAKTLSPDDTRVSCGLGVAFAQQCRWSDAERTWKNTLRQQPDCRDALECLAHAYRHLGNCTQAIQVLRKLEQIEPNRCFQDFELATCGHGHAPNHAPAEWVQQLFDRFAHSFDRKLAQLNYCGPELIERVLRALLGNPGQRLHVLDAGCGTGLCGEALSAFAKQLVGIDLSSKMLNRARKREVYDELIQGDLIQHLRSRHRYDIIMLADVLVYFGQLQGVLQAAQSSLNQAGLVVFTVEVMQSRNAASGFALQPNGRYRHTETHVRNALATAGLQSMLIDRSVVRNENGQPVHSLVGVGRKPSTG